MNVSLTPQLEEFVKQKVRYGLYGSASEVVREALRLLEVRDRQLEALRKEIAIGTEQADRGEVAPLDIEAIKREGSRILAQHQSHVP